MKITFLCIDDAEVIFYLRNCIGRSSRLNLEMSTVKMMIPVCFYFNIKKLPNVPKSNP